MIVPERGTVQIGIPKLFIAISAVWVVRESVGVSWDAEDCTKAKTVAGLLLCSTVARIESDWVVMDASPGNITVAPLIVLI